MADERMNEVQLKQEKVKLLEKNILLLQKELAEIKNELTIHLLDKLINELHVFDYVWTITSTCFNSHGAVIYLTNQELKEKLLQTGWDGYTAVSLGEGFNLTSVATTMYIRTANVSSTKAKELFFKLVKKYKINISLKYLDDQINNMENKKQLLVQDRDAWQQVIGESTRQTITVDM